MRFSLVGYGKRLFSGVINYFHYIQSLGIGGLVGMFTFFANAQILTINIIEPFPRIKLRRFKFPKIRFFYLRENFLQCARINNHINSLTQLVP